MSLPPTPSRPAAGARDRPLGPGFDALLRGSLITNTGDGIRLAALPLLAASLTSSPLLISAVTAAQYLPWATFAPLGGVIVDRRDRRQTILVTQTWRALVMVALAASVGLDLVAIWQLCVVAFVVTVGEIMVDPAIVALVPTVVEDEDLDRANGRIASAEIVTNDFAGGPIGAVAFGLAPWLPFVIDGASYLGSVLPFRRLPTERPRPSRPDPRPDGRRTRRDEALEGFTWLRRHLVLGPLTAAQVVSYLGASAGLSLLVVLVTIELDASALTFGAVLAAGALGAVVGSLAGGRVARAVGVRATLAGAVAAQGATLAAAAISRSALLVVVLWLLNGLPAGAQRPIARSMQQRLTPNHLLGRINVTARIFTRGIIIVGALAAGALATATSVRGALALGGVVQLVAAALVWRALAPSRLR
ncbi:MFS transporter [Iamia sp. SCSIO 61187]|uniref:MFS transporter n=1 Tax=Iamia sp. SCSIO 61187 TaxID=2722752 RepID=UPI001C62AF81|nr:MFS transporter [Iamia sp. SCSIO 61187]QYG92699.1 MFS transporter [Iamia sp. SCSIO 61187]